MESLILASWDKYSERLMAVRTTVFVMEQGIPLEIEQDEWDAKSIHVLLSINSKDVGTGRLLPTGYIGRVCVIKEFRGTGEGRKIMTALIEEAQKQGMNEVALSSQVQAADFYKSLGFEQVSEEYEEAGIPHIKMKKKLGSL